MSDRRRLPGRAATFLRRRSATLIVGGLALVLVVLSLFVDIRTAETETVVAAEQRDATAEQAVAAADPVLELCQEDTAVAAALRADSRNPCGLAAQVVASPVVTPVTVAGERGPQGPAPTGLDVMAAVRVYLAANPPPAGRPPTVQEITAAVGQVLADNPPDPGRPPTAAEIAAAVAAYIADNPTQPGRDGDPGRPPSAEEIRAAVAQYLTENPAPAGAAGAAGREGQPGVQGVGVSNVRSERRDEGCFLVFTLSDPVDGSAQDRELPAGDAVCGTGGLLVGS